MTERELFLYELSGRGFEFKNKTWLSGLGEHDGFFEDDQLNMVWEMWQAATQRDGFKFVPVENIKSIYTACNNALDINDVDIYKGLAMAIIDDCEDMIGVIDDH